MNITPSTPARQRQRQARPVAPQTLRTAIVCGIATLALTGCASRKQPFEEPRAATVIEITLPESGYDKVRHGIHAGIFGALNSLAGHSAQGGSTQPASLGPAVGGIVADTRAAVSDACSRRLLLEFHDDQKRVFINTRCQPELVVGQRVSVVRNQAGKDPRDLLTISALQ